jgi:hypothetical protein
VLSLKHYVERYCSDQFGINAASIVELANEIRQAIAKGDAHIAASSALALGLKAEALAFEHEFGSDLIAGQRLRLGGIKGFENRGIDRDMHAAWAARDRDLMRERPELGERARAEIIARENGARSGRDIKRQQETIRRCVREQKKSERAAQ